MKALIYHGPEKKNWESKADPAVERATDAVVRIDTTTICGTDLHILKGDVPAVTDGRTLGHEGVGTVGRGLWRTSGRVTGSVSYYPPALRLPPRCRPVPTAGPRHLTDGTQAVPHPLGAGRRRSGPHSSPRVTPVSPPCTLGSRRPGVLALTRP